MRTLILVALLALGMAAETRAQGAADYYHGGAAKYIQGRNQEALIEIEEGLRRYPEDPQLKALAGHLRKLKDQQKQDGQQGGSEGDQGEKEEQKKDQSQGDQSQDEQEKKQGEEDKPEEKEEQDKQGQSGAEAGDEEKDAKDSAEAEAPVKPGEMSKEDAERLLNSVQDDEKKEHKNMQRRYRKKVEVEQDW